MSAQLADIKWHPITFQHYLVGPILADTKTQTRRVMTKQPPAGTTFFGHEMPRDVWHPCNGDPRDVETWGGTGDAVRCPYGQSGDRLWVRECWAFGENKPGMLGKFWEGGVPWTGGGPDVRAWRENVILYYKANNEPVLNTSWRSSRFMPRWASRLNVEIVDIRAQRLQDITEDDAADEGIVLTPCTHPDCIASKKNGLKSRCAADSFRGAFAVGWDKINGRRGYTWQSNPWVWCLSFRRINACQPL